MNAERLHAIGNAVADELSAGQIPGLLRQLVTALQQSVQEPAQPAHQQSVSSLRQQLNEALEEAQSNHFSPAWREALEEMGIADVLGTTLATRITSIFERNEITPSAAVEELTPLADRVEALAQALEQIRTGLELFGIGAEELMPGEFELGFLIPRPAVDNELQELGEEFTQLKRILGPFLELSTGSRPDVSVRSLSSSSFQVFLNSAPATALLVATALERLISSYEKVVNIRLAHQQLKDAGASERTLKSAEEDAAGMMEREIADVADDLLSERAALDQGRANELRMELIHSLNALANRIDDGYSIEVRAGEVTDPDEEDESDGEDSETDELRQIAEAVISKQERLKFANLTGKPILQLPEGDDIGPTGADQSAAP